MNPVHGMHEFVEGHNPPPLAYNSRSLIPSPPPGHPHQTLPDFITAFFETLRKAIVKFFKRGLFSRVSVGARSED